MRKQLLLVILFLVSFSGMAQKPPNLSEFKTQEQKLQHWLNYCEAVLETDDYTKLVAIAKQGIALAKNNNTYLAKFFTSKRMDMSTTTTFMTLPYPIMKKPGNIRKNPEI